MKMINKIDEILGLGVILFLFSNSWNKYQKYLKSMRLTLKVEEIFSYIKFFITKIIFVMFIKMTKRLS